MREFSNRQIVWSHEVKRFGCAVIAAVVMAVNIKTFVRAGSMFPGGFNGLTLLVQKIFAEYGHMDVPFTAINLALNALPIFVGFRFVGKKFTISSCCVVFLTSILTDMIPSQPITYDPLLISIFGGLINGAAISLCLVGNTSSGGTDFFAIYFSEKHGRDIWNYILGANALMLFTAGLLFGSAAARYSRLIHITSTHVVPMLHQRYKKHTLFIITEHPEEVYESIRYLSHHSATRFEGTGCYSDKKLTLLYSVVSREEAKLLVRNVHEVDPHAFVNIIKTDYINGRFYHKTDY